MGAHGPHDDFDAAEAVIEGALAAFAGGDFEAARTYVDEGLEHVTRDGVIYGADRLVEDFSPQFERWTMSFYLEELIDAGDGALIALLEVERRDRESGEVAWKAWPAQVLRVNRGKVVFLEGYIDRRKAFADLGVAVKQ